MLAHTIDDVGERNPDVSNTHPDPEGRITSNDSIFADSTNEDVDEPNSNANDPVPKTTKVAPQTPLKRLGEICNCKEFGTKCPKCCPYFPVCCNFQLKTVLQLLAAFDLLVCLVLIAFWGYYFQLDLFVESGTSYLNISKSIDGNPGPVSYRATTDDTKEYYESTTLLGPPLFDDSVDEAVESLSYSKIALLLGLFQQEVENGCGRKYYIDNLLGHRLNITRELFHEIMHTNFLVEFIYVYIALSILVTTCCYSKYSSAKVYLVIVWHLELLPVYFRIWTTLLSQSQRLCIMEYGDYNEFRGLKFLFWLHLVPLVTYRPYKLLVFTYFIKLSFTTAGNIQIQTRPQTITLGEYISRREALLKMDKNRDKSSSGEDEFETIL